LINYFKIYSSLGDDRFFVTLYLLKMRMTMILLLNSSVIQTRKRWQQFRRHGVIFWA